ncbi:MAG TPA: hypothetical protein VNO86_06315 [Candidatus Binatia bacterium]|nr:hypothetical protein [Candidatus Binatia bacterium]
MRVRQFELRLLAAALTGAWAATGVLVLVGYRPGGPIDLLVGLAACLPTAIAAAGLRWPPVPRGRLAFPSIVTLGTLSLLVLVPSIGGLVLRLIRGGPQTLLPSVEAAYPWLLALAGTSLFAGFGLARRLLGWSAGRRRRLAVGSAIGAALTIVTASAVAATAVANDLALRDRPVPGSIYGPTDPSLEPPACDAEITAGRSARLSLKLSGEVDLRPIGEVDIAGLRVGDDFRWSGYAATPVALGTYGAARIGSEAWRALPRIGWFRVAPAEVAGADLDRRLVAVALAPENRTAAEDRGIATIGGARARHCRIAVDGSTVRSAVWPLWLLVGDASLRRWRGQLDYWIFADGQVGRVEATVNGEAYELSPPGLLATVRLELDAVARGQDASVARPTP